MDQHPHPLALTPHELEMRKPFLGSRAGPLALGAGVLGAAGLATAYGLGAVQGDGLRHFYFAYLVAYCFWLSIGLGSLFFILIHYLFRDTSAVVLRRLAETFAGTLPFMAVLLLPVVAPVLAGSHALYHWLDPAVREADHLLIHKAPFLNLGFFIARIVAYFVIWSLLAWYFRSRSLKQDATGDHRLTRRMWILAAPAVVVLALTVTFFAIDMVMSLDAHWFSTIFGVYFFAGAMTGFFAALALVAVLLQRSGLLQGAITAEHYHDLGKLLFTFLFFWGYIAFSQYMLYWYGNIPEETEWFLRRQSGEWLGWSLLLLFGHLLIPFAILLSRYIKRRRRFLAPMAVWMLIAHWVDLYWLIMPEFSHNRVPLSFLDLAALLGVGGLFVAVAVQLARPYALAPLRDPHLADSLKFENV
jgi:hypothetical protein